MEIEERDSSEVLSNEKLAQLPNVSVRNPAFDVTPREYIDLICTEVGAIPPEMAYVIIKEFLGWGIEDYGVIKPLDYLPESQHNNCDF